MKGMRKISRGSDFRGVMAYIVDGELDNPREIKGELIGGNMSGRTPQELAEEFNLSKAIRPDIKRPVWHNSLRLPLGEKIDKETWNKIADRYMEKMGFSEHHQRSYFFDDDPKGQHIHIPASRIGLDGTVFLGKNENLKSTKVIAELEVEFGLKLTKGVNYDQAGKIVMPDKSKVSKAEMEKALRTETEPPRVQLQKLVDQALTGKPTATEFVERLQASGVDVVPNIASTGKLNGFSFGLDGPNGVFFSGSKLGDSYKYAQLEKRGLTYDQNRESGFLIELKTRARDAVERDRAAKGVEGVQPRSADRASDPAAARDAEHLRRVDSGADRASDRAPGADSAGSQGRDERAENDRRDPEPVSESRDTSPEAGSESKADAGTEAGAQRPHDSGAALARSSEPGHHHGDVGNGIATGVEVSSAGLITTGDKAIDELLQAAHSGRLKAEREVLSRQKKQHHEDMANSKKRQAALDKPHTNRLSMLAGRSMDSTWRELEIQRLAQAMGAQQFQVVSKPANAKAASITTVYTAEQMKDPKVIKDLAHQAARNHSITIQPHDSAGMILMKGLDAQDITKLEAAGLPPAAVVTFAGKFQAWVATGEKLTADERSALTKRIEGLVGVEKKVGMAGRMVGFAGASLSACPGQVAPAARELVGEVRAQIFEAKKLEDQKQVEAKQAQREAVAAQRLDNAIKKEVVVQAHDFTDHGGKMLRKDWLSKRCYAVEADATLLGGKYDAAHVESRVLEAMARQGVTSTQAYYAVLDGSRVGKGNAKHAAESVAQAFTRVRLATEGIDLASVDIEAESRKRFPNLLKRAESGQDAQVETIHAGVKVDGDADSARLAADAELHRSIKAALAAAQDKVDEMKLQKPGD